MKTRLRRSFLLSALLSGSAQAAQWDISPTISVAERYTDNAALAPDTTKRSDWISQVTPGLSVAATGARLKFNAVYAPEFYYYAQGTSDNQVFQRGNAAGTAELAKQLFFLDFGGKVDQYNASLQGPQAASNANPTANRVTVGSYYASPYFRRDFGSNVQGEARFTGSLVNSDDTALLANSVAERLDLRLNSGPAYKLFTWNVDYFRENYEFDQDQNNVLSEVVTAHSKRLITPTVGLLLQVGYDRYKLGDDSLSGKSWSGGFDWTPSPRTHFAATAGRRFYGDDYALDLSHRSRLTTFGIVYTQAVATTRSEFFAFDPTRTSGYLNTLFSSQYKDPVERAKAVEDYMARTALPPGLSAPTNFFTTDLFLVKRWQASAGILGVRNVVIGYLFKEKREVLLAGAPGGSDAGDFATGNTINQAGASFQWNWRMTGRDSLNMSGGYNRNEFSGSSRIDKIEYAGLGVSRVFQPTLVGSVNYRRQEGRSNFIDGSYTENAVFVSVQKRFRP